MNERRILALLKSGQVLFHYPLKVHFEAGAGDFGVSVPKRLFKRAVKRNLLKRRVREAWRLNAARLGKNALCICTVSDQLVRHEYLSADERQTGFEQMMKVALETAVKLEK